MTPEQWAEAYRRLWWKSSTRGSRARGRSLIYWLNPSEQHANNFGWFTVEELDAWIKGKGPIPKKKEVVCRDV